MNLKELINKSYYGTIGYISSKQDLDLLQQFIMYNLSVLKQYKGIIVATNYKEGPDKERLVHGNDELWRAYFPDCELITSKINRGLNFGYCDLDDLIVEHCKSNGIGWLCKSANDMIITKELYYKEIPEADFYYYNGIDYNGMAKYDFDNERIVNEDFYPQTNFYFINLDKVDYLNDGEHVNEIYEKVQSISDYSGKAGEYGFRSCETLLKECVERNRLSKNHLVPLEKYERLLSLIKGKEIHYCSHKNLMVSGICHFAYPDQTVLVL